MPLRATLIVVLVLVSGCRLHGVGRAAVARELAESCRPRRHPRHRRTRRASGAAADGPPAARLAAEGGDAVAGQLGTYIWGDAGSDSPWLPGAPISVGAGEPLTVSFDPALPVASWRARMVSSDADGPDGARVLGEGAGDPSFQAPGAGSWTVECSSSSVRGDGRCQLLLASRGQTEWRRRGNARLGARRRHAYVEATGWPAEKIDTCASSGSITPKTFWSVRRWTQEPQLSK